MRRRRDTVGDLDIVVCAAGNAMPIMAALLAYPQVTEVMASGPTRSSLCLKSGMQVDVRIVGRMSFGSTLQYFTGSKAHGIALRRRAPRLGCKLNEYGLYRGAERLAGDTEQGLYHALGLPWIAPELREDRGEIDAAERHGLPVLIEPSDLRGDLHCHTRARTIARKWVKPAARRRHQGTVRICRMLLAWNASIRRAASVAVRASEPLCRLVSASSGLKV